MNKHNNTNGNIAHGGGYNKLVISTLTLSTLLSSSILAPSLVNAEGETSVVDDVTITIPTACSLSSTISTGNEHTATITPGSYEDNIGTTDLKALCNDFNGFSIYAIGYSNNAQGTPTMGNNTMIGTNTSSTIATGTATSGNTSNWAMKLTKVTNPVSGDPITYNPDILNISTGFDDYHAVPNSLTKVVEYKDSTVGNSSATDQTLGAHIETTYATYVAGTQPADTYNGKVKYLLVHPANFTTGTYTISYDANHGTGTMNQETNIPNYEPHTIPTSTITPPEGYVLAGWCTESDNTATSQNPQTTCNGTSYNDKGTIPASTVPANSSITLYAYWGLPTMQTVSTWGSTLTNVGDEITAIDTRDGKEYTVAKLADENIWMTQNLDLDLATTTSLTSDNTNLTKMDEGNTGAYTADNGYIKNDQGVISWTPANTTIKVTGTSVPGWGSDSNVPYSADPDNIYYYTTGDNSSEEAISKTACEQAHQDGSCAHYHAGNYYSWSAAVASNNTASWTDDDQYVNAENSICPKGWRLPKNANANSYIEGNEQITMINSYNDILGEYSPYGPPGGYYNYLEGGFNKIRTAPLWLVRSGSVDNGSLGSAGDSGFYWSSTVYSSGSAYFLSFGGSNVYPANYNSRLGGYSVRCVAQ